MLRRPGLSDILIDDGVDLSGRGAEIMEFEIVTSIRFKAISFRKAYVRGVSCPYRWRVLSGTWR